MTARGLVIAAPRSGSGKTTVALMLLAALRRRGLAVRAAKNGPDYIDPMFHEAATGHPCLNLDSWAMSPALLDNLLARSAGNGELLVIEAAMGLFDGVDGVPGRCGRAADLAARWNLPVVLVLDVSGQSQSAAAVARGFMTHEAGVEVAGVVLNQVGSARHAAQATAALREAGVPVLGSIARDQSLTLPERHLGLVQAREHDGLAERIERLATVAEATLALDDVLALARTPREPIPAMGENEGIAAMRPPGQRIAVADDAAFTFLYPHVLAGWRELGAQVLRFSPLADEAPPATADCCWLPGGYPELHAEQLAAADRFRNGIAAFSRTRPVHGECGGYMVLGDFLTTADGIRHRMTGLLGVSTDFARRRLHLGYREAVLLDDGILGDAGTVLRGHEFHYATEDNGTDLPLVSLRDAAGTRLGTAGSRRGSVSGSFFHVIAGGASA